MTSKNETGAFIKYFGNSKSQLTEPETVVRGILKELGYGYRLQEPIAYTCEPRKLGDPLGGVFIIDLLIPDQRICVEVDGIHHRTARQERKTKWRDAQLIANGYSILHIDAEWTETRERRTQLSFWIEDAIKGLIAGEQTRRIVV